MEKSRADGMEAGLNMAMVMTIGSGAVATDIALITEREDQEEAGIVMFLAIRAAGAVSYRRCRLCGCRFVSDAYKI